MPIITYADQRIGLEENETVLEALLRGGVSVPSSCRAGACQTCLMRATEGTPPPASQQGLKDSLKARGYFLSCVCRPTESLSVAPPDAAAARARASVLRVEKLGGGVARLLLSCAAPFDYRAGQFVNLIRPDGLARSYSIASLPGRDPHLELHVRKVSGGRMSTWIHDELRGGEDLEVHGPVGDCFYVPGRTEQPVLLVGTGTGLAPLYGIVQDALGNGHAGPLHLYHGALDEEKLYLVEELRKLSARHPNLTYTRCVMNGLPSEGVRVGDIGQIVLAAHPKLAGWRVFLCGNPALVQGLRKKTFLAGAKMSDIHADAFLPAAKA